MSAISQHKSGHKTNMKSIVLLYFNGNFFSWFNSCYCKFLVPSISSLVEGATGIAPPEGVVEVLRTLLLNIVDNPINALKKCKLHWYSFLGTSF